MIIENNRTNVLDAIDVVLEGIESELESANREGVRAFESGDHQKVKDALERTERIKDLQDRIEAIRNDCKTLLSEGETKGGSKAQNGGRLEPGVRTPEDRYYLPILESL